MWFGFVVYLFCDGFNSVVLIFTCGCDLLVLLSFVYVVGCLIVSGVVLIAFGVGGWWVWLACLGLFVCW